jgi:hypothetical protein
VSPVLCAVALPLMYVTAKPLTQKNPGNNSSALLILSRIQYYPLDTDQDRMERHPTAQYFSSAVPGLVRVSDDHPAAHARGKAHTSLS